jgi:hypothetical protein
MSSHRWPITHTADAVVKEESFPIDNNGCAKTAAVEGFMDKEFDESLSNKTLSPEKA